MSSLQQRMKNPVYLVPEALQALYTLGAAAKKGPVPLNTLYLVHLRASQINGCSYCVEMHSHELKDAGVSVEKIFAVSGWRESPHFTDAERAALALTEAATRISDQSDPVSNEVWEEAKHHYDEKALAYLIINIAMINFWNRINVPVRQVAGSHSS
jgi:alkylhydroperoxidase AhpD family core domain